MQQLSRILNLIDYGLITCDAGIRGVGIFAVADAVLSESLEEHPGLQQVGHRFAKGLDLFLESYQGRPGKGFDHLIRGRDEGGGAADVIPLQRTAAMHGDFLRLLEGEGLVSLLEGDSHLGAHRRRSGALEDTLIQYGLELYSLRRVGVEGDGLLEGPAHHVWQIEAELNIHRV